MDFALSRSIYPVCINNLSPTNLPILSLPVNRVLRSSYVVHFHFSKQIHKHYFFSDFIVHLMLILALGRFQAVCEGISCSPCYTLVAEGVARIRIRVTAEQLRNSHRTVLLNSEHQKRQSDNPHLKFKIFFQTVTLYSSIPPMFAFSFVKLVAWFTSHGIWRCISSKTRSDCVLVPALDTGAVSKRSQY